MYDPPVVTKLGSTSRSRAARKQSAQFDRADKGARRLGRSTRGLINPLIGATLVSGILGGGLLSLALSSGSASNSLIRIQGSLEGLVSAFTRKLEPGIDKAAGTLEKLPIGAQVAVVATGGILGVGLIATIAAGSLAVGTAVTTFAATHIGAPLVAGAVAAQTSAGAAITRVAGPLVTSITASTALAVGAVVVGLAAIALLAWDEIFNDGNLGNRFDEWLRGAAWFDSIRTWDEEVLEPAC